MTSCRYGHELVSTGHWGPGTPLSEGIAPTNIDGIGLKINVRSSDGQNRTLLQTPLPVAVEKEPVQYDSAAAQACGSTLTTNYVQQLILTVEPSQLPAGKLIVERVAGSSQLTLYAIDLRIPRHLDTHSTIIWTVVPRSLGQAVVAQRRRFVLLV